MKSINWKKPNEKEEDLQEQVQKLEQTLAEREEQILEYQQRQRTLRNTIRNLEYILSRIKHSDSFIPITTKKGPLPFGSN